MVKGTLHIARQFYGLENEGVYDVVFTRDRQKEPDPKPVVRRFFGEQELANFLTRHLRRDPTEVKDLIRRITEENHADIPSLEFRPEELRKLKLAT